MATIGEIIAGKRNADDVARFTRRLFRLPKFQTQVAQLRSQREIERAKRELEIKRQRESGIIRIRSVDYSR